MNSCLSSPLTTHHFDCDCLTCLKLRQQQVPKRQKVQRRLSVQSDYDVASLNPYTFSGAIGCRPCHQHAFCHRKVILHNRGRILDRLATVAQG